MSVMCVTSTAAELAAISFVAVLFCFFVPPATYFRVVANRSDPLPHSHPMVLAPLYSLVSRARFGVCILDVATCRICDYLREKIRSCLGYTYRCVI